MRILLVKLSSLGDVIHNLPVASDLARALPGVEIDWAIEAPYAEIAALHPAVRNVLPVPLRRLRKQWWSPSAWSGFLVARGRLTGARYDLILDTQGLLKSALVARWPAGPVCGHAASSAREPVAARFYDRHYDIPRALHAVERNRLLAAHACGYQVTAPLSYGLRAPAARAEWLPASPYVVFLHATSRANKTWPDRHWMELGRHLRAAGVNVVLPWGSERERETSRRLAAEIAGAIVAPRISLRDGATMLAAAAAVVGVDTGLAHMAVALDRPTIGLYMTTQPALTGLHGGSRTINLGGGSEAAPTVPAIDSVWQVLRPWLADVA